MKLTGYVIARREPPPFDKIELKLLFRYSGLHCFEGLETLIHPSGRTLVSFGSLAEAVKFIITGDFADTAEIRICEEARDNNGLPNGICFVPVSYNGGKR